MAEINFQQGAAPGQGANEVLAYRGNPAMAGGYDGSGLPSGTGADSLATVNDMVDTMNRNQVAANLVKHKEKIDDRDKTLALMQDPSLMMSNDIMDEDRPALEQKRQDFMDAWKKNPNLMSDPQAYLDFKKKSDDFREAAASSKSRNIERKRQLQAIAAEPITERRDAKLLHLHDQINRGIMHQIDPHFDNPTFNPDDYFKDVPLSQVGDIKRDKGEDGLYMASKTMQTPISAFKQQYAPERLLGNGGKGLQDLQLLQNNFPNTDFANDANLERINNKLNKINQDNNQTPGMPDYLNPIAQKIDGKWHITPSPVDLATALHIDSKYKRVTNTDLDKNYTDEMFKKQKNDEDQEKNKALINLYEAQAEKARKDGDKEATGKANSKLAVISPVNDAVKAFDDALQSKKFVPFSQLPKNFYSSLKNSLEGNTIDDNAMVADLPKDQSYLKMLSESGVDANGKNNGTINKVRYIYAIKSGNDISSLKLVGFDSNKQMIKSVDLANGVEEAIKYNNGYKSNAKTTENIESARQVLTEMLNGRNKKATPAASVSTIPEPIRKLSGGDKAELVKAANGDSFYSIGDDYFYPDGRKVTQ